MDNLWSVAGPFNRANVNITTFQYFINYNLLKDWYLVTSPINTADWAASSENRWTVPVDGGFDRVFHIGKQALNAFHKGVKSNDQ